MSPKGGVWNGVCQAARSGFDMVLSRRAVRSGV
jgi:hypothetical protein